MGGDLTAEYLDALERELGMAAQQVGRPAEPLRSQHAWGAAADEHGLGRPASTASGAPVTVAIVVGGAGTPRGILPISLAR